MLDEQLDCIGNYHSDIQVNALNSEFSMWHDKRNRSMKCLNWHLDIVKLSESPAGCSL